MKKYLLTAAVAFGALTVAVSGASAKSTFALVPKNMNNPFFDQARDGCKKAEAESNGAFECMYIGPGEHGGGDEQVQIVQDLVAKKVDGIAVAPSNAAAMAVALQAAKDAGIPVLTWDSDTLPENKDLRLAYIGTHNYEIGVNLAKIAMEVKPKGGTICIQSGGAAASNHNERMQGIRDMLSGTKSAASPGDPLTGQNGWTEIAGCPLYTNDDFPLSVQQFEDIMAKNPDLDAFIPTGGFPQFIPDANRAAVGKYKDKIASKSLALVVADTLPVQIDQMKEGLSLGQVGQRPFEMGYKTMMALWAMKKGEAAPAASLSMILADTSIWVDHLRKGDMTMQRLLQQQLIVMHPFIIGEIALGHLGNRGVILQSLWELPAAAVANDKEVLRFIDSHALFGLGIGFVDAHLLASAKLSTGTRLWTRDRKLAAAAAVLRLETREGLD